MVYKSMQRKIERPLGTNLCDSGIQIIMLHTFRLVVIKFWCWRCSLEPTDFPLSLQHIS